MELRDVVETALAEALMLAARAARWEIVERIAAELTERRVSRATSSVSTESGADRARTPVGAPPQHLHAFRTVVNPGYRRADPDGS